MAGISKAILTGAAAVFLFATAQAAEVDRIVAVVNDEVITLSELNGAFAPYAERVMATTRGAEQQRVLTESRLTLLNRMVDELLMEQHARKAGIVIRDEDVNNAIEDLLKRKKASREELQKALSREGITFDAYRKGMRDQLMRVRLVQREIKSKVTVSDEEIGEYYRKNRDQYEGKEAVRIMQILLLLPKNPSPAEREKVRANAAALHGRLLQGEPFNAICASYSQGPAADTGGDVGFVEKGTMLPEVEEVAFRLPLNQISPVIESPVGYHIVRVIDRRGAGLTAIETVREEIRDKLEMEKVEKKFEEWVAALRGKSHVEIKL